MLKGRSEIAASQDDVAVVIVIANYECRGDTGDEVEAALREHSVATRTEPGCISFSAYRNAEQPDRFVLVEQYVNEAALRTHRETAHFRQFIEARVMPLLVERTWSRYDEVGDHRAG